MALTAAVAGTGACRVHFADFTVVQCLYILTNGAGDGAVYLDPGSVEAHNGPSSDSTDQNCINRMFRQFFSRCAATLTVG